MQAGNEDAASIQQQARAEITGPHFIDLYQIIVIYWCPTENSVFGSKTLNPKQKTRNNDQKPMARLTSLRA
jgi:hypothetical protein